MPKGRSVGDCLPSGRRRPTFFGGQGGNSIWDGLSHPAPGTDAHSAIQALASPADAGKPPGGRALSWPVAVAPPLSASPRLQPRTPSGFSGHGETDVTAPPHGMVPVPSAMGSQERSPPVSEEGGREPKPPPARLPEAASAGRSPMAAVAPCPWQGLRLRTAQPKPFHCLWKDGPTSLEGWRPRPTVSVDGGGKPSEKTPSSALPEP